MHNASLRNVSVRAFTSLLVSCWLFGCGNTAPGGPPEIERDLRINEVVADNEGVHLDELGEADDYIEVVNGSLHPLNLGDYLVQDATGVFTLPSVELAPGEVQVLWADDSPEQGPLHLPFKVSATGETLELRRAQGHLVDSVVVPALGPHEAYVRSPDVTGAFAVCGWATPARPNGSSCGPPAPPEPPADVVFAPFQWPEPWPAEETPLVINELALRPARFVELINRSDAPLSLTDFALRLSDHAIGQPWPGPGDGAALALPPVTVPPGGHEIIPVAEGDLAGLGQGADFEGVATVFDSAGTAVDRTEFSSWPEDAVLARFPDRHGPYRLCASASPGEANEQCDQLAERPLANHVRRLVTPGDFHALAAGRRTTGADSVEFLVDLAGGGAVTFLDSAVWDLHYTFVREVIEGHAHLDRCDPAQREQFNAGWYAFSEQQYFHVETRRYLLGNLVRHAGSGLSTLEFGPGDVISAEQMKHAFFTVMKSVPDPTAWAIRPQTPDQVQRIGAIEGQVPIVGPKAPFRDVTFQSLTPGVAYGTLRFARAVDIRQAGFGPRDIVITDQVPNDIPLIGGLVTEAFQTPLAHVNVLSRGRGTPNMALAGARVDPRVAPYLEELVRLEVTGSDFSLTRAMPEEALAFWASRKPEGPPLQPRLDVAPRGVQPLAERSIADLPSIGGKAAQFSELYRTPLCVGFEAAIPQSAFAIPVAHSVDHFRSTGAEVRLRALQTDAAFLADPRVRAAGLAEVQALVRGAELAPELLATVLDAIAARWGGAALRFRSSSNAEDLPGFSGAGLYESVGVDRGDDAAEVSAAIREVWASLWTLRAYDERDYYNLDHSSVAMAVLVHGALRSERVNGVAISRDVLDPSRGDRQYFNVQVGEALVTNPAPAVVSEEFTHSPGGWLPIEYHERSSFSPDRPVVSQEEVAKIGCNLDAIEAHFRPLVDPDRKNPWFAVDIEFKLMGPERALVIKQARPYSFGSEAPTNWCDF